MKTRHHLPLIALVAALFAAQAHATDIYRWTDETGRVHLGDSVPERYRSQATRTDSSQYLARDAELRGVAPQNATECAAAHRAFRASQACFAPFRNVNGSLKPEAMSVCREVVDPTTRCGPSTVP